MSKGQQGWTFFVDESGTFEDPHAPVSVAGLLLADSIPQFGSSELKGTLAKAVPWLPWPLHACFVNQPAYIAIAANQYGLSSLESFRPALGSAIKDAVQCWESITPAEFQAVASAVQGGQKPSMDALTLLRDLLRQKSPGALTVLQEASREGWRAINAVADRLIAARDRLGRPVAFFVASSETTRGDGGRNDADRYFAIVKAGVERAAALLDRFEGKHRLALNVQQRYVFDARFNRRVMLTPQHIGSAVAQVRELHPRVHIVVNETPAFTSEIGVEYVLADFLANRSHRILDDGSADLEWVEDQLGEYFGSPLRSGEPARSHLSASGEAFQFVTAQHSGQESLEWQGARRRWACEQASQWAGGAA